MVVIEDWIYDERRNETRSTITVTGEGSRTEEWERKNVNCSRQLLESLLLKIILGSDYATKGFEAFQADFVALRYSPYCHSQPRSLM